MTHLLTGACLARAGFNRKAAYATLAMTLAAEAPDLDTFWAVDGPVAAFQHHRGITHTFLGVPFEACLIVAVVWLVHQVRVRRSSTGVARTGAPVRWGLLWLFALVGLLSHLLLDYTNNYGLRPFFPFNPRWYAGSIVFIFEPVLFVALLAALLLPALFRLINAEVGATRVAFRGAGWARAALMLMLALWMWRFVEQRKAIRMAGTMDLSAGRSGNLVAVPILRISANPYPINPYSWHMVVETPGFYQVGTADTLSETFGLADAADVIYKPATTVATLAAKRSRLGEAYLDWSSFPVVTQAAAAKEDGTDESSVVTFRDLRFFYDVAFLNGRGDAPLTGKVFLDGERRVLRMEMNGRSEP